MKKFIKWIDNYWYHYKWQTIIAAFFVVVVGICAAQMFNRQEYDAYVMYAGGDFFTIEQEHAMLNALSTVSDDYDGNGEKSLCMNKLFVLSEQELEDARDAAEAEGEKLAYNVETRKQTLEQFQVEMMTGHAYVCLLSEDMYARCEDKERFVSVSELLGYTPAGAYDEYAVRFSETEFGQYFAQAFEPLGEGTLICLRQISLPDAQNKNARAEYENYRALFRGILEFTVKK